jgi:hypothetical protein
MEFQPSGVLLLDAVVVWRCFLPKFLVSLCAVILLTGIPSLIPTS